jgi:AAA family ATPase
LTKAQLEDIGSKTHGYVGADLAAVVREAGTRVIKRLMHQDSSSQTVPSQSNLFEGLGKITYEDILAVLPLIPPSALRSLTLPVQNTPWSSLGGKSVQVIRQKLTEAITWPLMHPEAFERFGVQAPRGVLLYGPPGCSKTMVGRALASESGVNFLAVRGPEVSCSVRDCVYMWSAHVWFLLVVKQVRW